MFARANRFSFKNGMPKHFTSARFFTVRYDSNTNDLKCGVVVGKKVDKRAVVRNRLKRRLVALIKEFVPAEKQVRLVVIAKPALKDADTEAIKDELLKTLTSIHIL